MISTDMDFQIRSYCTEVLEIETVDSISEIRTRSPRGGYYQLLEIQTSGGTQYFLAVSAGSSFNVFPATDDYIEEIFGYETVPDRSEEGVTRVLPSE